MWIALACGFTRILVNVTGFMTAFASGVCITCTSSAKLNSGIIPHLGTSLAFHASWHTFSNILSFLVLCSLLFTSLPTSFSTTSTLKTKVAVSCKASTSCIANAACKFMIAFQIPSGNSPIMSVSIHSPSVRVLCCTVQLCLVSQMWSDM